MSIPQTIIDIPVICSHHGIDQLVMCPGSRNAPLTLAFARYSKITARVISDERSAGYIALGISQSLNRPVVLLSTSGTAALNFGPSIAEAFYQQIPLLVLTADRPPEWIDHNDGQSVRQTNVFQNHTKKSFQLPVDLAHKDAKWHAQRIINEAILTSTSGIPGPVHINVPFREPLYPADGFKWQYSKRVPVVKRSFTVRNLDHGQWDMLLQEWSKARKILVVGGQGSYSKTLCTALERFCRHTLVPIAGDVVSNLAGVAGLIQHVEIILEADEAVLETLKPDLLISFNQAIVSKNLKLFLRKYQPSQHWHVQLDQFPSDTFNCLSQIIPMDPAAFFDKLTGIVKQRTNNPWYKLWQKFETKAKQITRTFLSKDHFNELQVTGEIINRLGGKHLHLSNSSPVRLADLIGVIPEIIEISANRGTSGIDGCTSTAVGHALVNQRTNVLITGDMAFFYDRNAFWHHYKLPNLKIIILNNHGGGIFKLIPGPREQPELEELFVTQQSLTAKNSADDFGLKYLYCNKPDDVFKRLEQLFETHDHATVLEIEFNQELGNIYQELKQGINKEL